MYRPAREYPSFSSSLLDEIYRSIDDRNDHELSSSRETKHNSFSRGLLNGKFSYNQDCLIENWMRKEVISTLDFKRRSGNSTSSSSDSSSGGGFSSSETESVYCVSSRPKPIRTNSNRNEQINMCNQINRFEDPQSNKQQKHEGRFVKTKSRAMKIYGDLKKAKQPISPGGRLATFLNSIFTTTKDSKVPSSTTYDEVRRSKSANGSTCSSASSLSRSCLSKTPSSKGSKSSNNKKRSVRFYPVSVIVGDDSQPCGHKSVYGDASIHALKHVKNSNDEKARRIEEAARSMLKSYQKKVEIEIDHLNYEDDEDADHYDDDVSNASSDLFELENFSAIGMENYGDELPVYETTRLDTSLALGNGFRCN